MEMAKTEEDGFGLQIAPMLDVLFVLLLFFMVSAGAVLKESELGVSLPAPGPAGGVSSMVVRIDIAANGAISWNGARLQGSAGEVLSDLGARLKDSIRLDRNQAVVIRPEPSVSHQQVVNVLEACSHAGIARVAFGGS